MVCNTLITGATGLVGSRLVKELENPIVVTRSRESAIKKFPNLDVQIIEWKDYNQSIEIPRNLKVDHVVNLMGSPVDGGRWTDSRKTEIRDSRVIGTRNLVKGLVENGHQPATFISASAIGYYGDRGDEVLDEQSKAGDDFLADVCREWEEEATQIQSHGSRLVIPRIGIVIARSGGAIKKMRSIFRWGIGGRIGSGKQWVSWIHIDDLIETIKHALNNESMNGVYNAVAPNPVTNLELTKQLASEIRRPAVLPVPAIGLRVLFGQLAEVFLASQRVAPKRILESGFQFSYTQLDEALRSVVNSDRD